VIAACGGDDALARFGSRVALVRHTRRTIVDRRELSRELERVRQQRYALVDQELELGLRSIAVPITAPDGSILAALNVGVQAGRLDVRSMQREILPALRSAAAEIAEAFARAIR
jgi:IclR family pca regulon transcriptional regulator